MKKSAPPKLKKFPAAKQRLLDTLLEKCSEGRITRDERARLERLVAEAEELMVANAQRLAQFSKSETARNPGRAVPVTVWLRPEPVER